MHVYRTRMVLRFLNMFVIVLFMRMMCNYALCLCRNFGVQSSLLPMLKIFFELN